MPIETNLDIVNKVGGALVTRLDELGIGNASGDLANFYPPMSGLLLAATVDGFIWHNLHTNAVFRVFRFSATTTVVGGSGATVQLVHCAQGVAIGSGTAQLTAALDLTTTAPARLVGTLIASPNDIFPGDCLGIDMSGTLTGLVGSWHLLLRRIR